jgi:hypothetical protein
MGSCKDLGGEVLAIADSLPDIYAISTLTYLLSSRVREPTVLFGALEPFVRGLAQMWMVGSHLPTLSPSRALRLKSQDPTYLGGATVKHAYSGG